MKQPKAIVVMAIILLGMGLVYYFAVFNKDGTTVDPDEIAFKIRDTSAVEEISLTLLVEEQPKNALTLKRQEDGRWQLNDTATANPLQVQFLLGTLHQLEMREPVNEQYRQNIFQQLKKRQIRVEIESDAGEDKTIYVGGATPDRIGTVMLLRGEDNPYVVEIPGFNGYLTPRFEPELKSYEEIVLFAAKPEAVREVEVTYIGQDSSFHLKKNGENWSMATGEPLNPEETGNYIQQFGKVYALAYADNDYPNGLDSLSRLQPDARLRIRTKGGKTQVVHLFQPPKKKSLMLGFHPDGNQLYYVQHAVIDKFLKKRQGFLPAQRPS